MKYNLSFTSGGLLYEESSIYIESIQDVNSYMRGEEDVSYFVLPTNSESSKKKLKSVIDKRLRQLNAEYLSFYRDIAQDTDRKIILFLAICKYYSIIAEFAIEVVYQKWKIFDNHLETYDFNYFLSQKLGVDELDIISENTKYKLSQVAILLFKQMGIYSSNKINTIQPSDELCTIIAKNNDEWFFNCLIFKKSNENF
ncbi:MAG: DUF1819 family protein [Flavobacteriaceae bacterium]|nr:DUF1819 family protein [Flavobacteriaceae bacterium]